MFTLNDIAAIATILSPFLALIVWLVPRPPREVKLFIIGVLLASGLIFLGIWIGIQQSEKITIANLGREVNTDGFKVFRQRGTEFDLIPFVTSDNIINAAGVEISSIRDENGYTKETQSVVFRLAQPIDRKPLGGIVTQILIEPDPGYEDVKIFCKYLAEYRLDSSQISSYASSEKYIALNTWNTMVWDFSGIIWPKGTSWESDWTDLSSILNSQGHYYMSIARRLDEQMLENAVGAQFNNGDATWGDRLKTIGIKCVASTNKTYTEISDVEFRGTFSLGNIWIQEIEYPGLR